MDARYVTSVKPAATIESFRPGDTVIVNVKIKEGDRERIQAFQGAVIVGSYAKGDNPAPGAMFTVRRVSYGIGVERLFPVCSPMIDSVKVVRKGKVRRARLYYLRGLTGRAARIKERRTLLQVPGAATSAAASTAVAEAAATEAAMDAVPPAIAAAPVAAASAQPASATSVQAVAAEAKPAQPGA